MEGNDMGFKPTVEWMAKKYWEMNEQVFNGELGDCDFGIFTTGRGSEGGVLGWFKITGRNIRVRRSTRRMFFRGWEDEEITNYNFVELCKPRIELNGNYSGKEESFLTTLVHEMCHYYTYMNGKAPVQAHGREFKMACAMVQSTSGGRFTIQRVATAEQMSGLKLSDEMKEKRQKRLESKKSKTTILVYWDRDGRTKLVTTTSKDLVKMIKLGKYQKLVVSNDGNLFDYLYNECRYRNNMRFGRGGWSYWNVTGKDWLKELDNYDIEVYENGEKVEAEKPVEQPNPEPPKEPEPIKIFTIKTNKGVVEIPMEPSMKQMFDKVKNRLPNLSDDAIMKLINNPANYKVMKESRNNVKKVLREVIEEFISNEDDSIAINPNENLGLNSPMENDF